MNRHVYFGIENLALSDEQRAQLVQALQALGPQSDPQPARLNHWRTRLDEQAAIFEALFDEDNITIEAFKQRLGSIFSVNPQTIDHDTNPVMFASRQSAVVTFSRNATDYLRAVFFGYAGADWPTWPQSGHECRAYLAANAQAWEEDLFP
jgi:hypothetical protein